MIKEKLIAQKADKDYVTDSLERMTEIAGSIVCQCTRSFGKLACAGFVIDGDKVYMVLAQNDNEYFVMAHEFTGYDVIEEAIKDFMGCFIARKTDRGFHIMTSEDFPAQ